MSPVNDCTTVGCFNPLVIEAGKGRGTGMVPTGGVVSRFNPLVIEAGKGRADHTRWRRDRPCVSILS